MDQHENQRGDKNEGKKKGRQRQTRSLLAIHDT
jgi:hypothetical protein